jgi:hypothetical protein
MSGKIRAAACAPALFLQKSVGFRSYFMPVSIPYHRAFLGRRAEATLPREMCHNGLAQFSQERGIVQPV